MSVLEDRLSKARKAHYCSSCLRVIPIGETYRTTVQTGDWGLERWKQCVHCEQILNWLYFTDDDARWCLNEGEFDLGEWLGDMYRDTVIHRLFVSRWASLVGEVSA